MMDLPLIQPGQTPTTDSQMDFFEGSQCRKGLPCRFESNNEWQSKLVGLEAFPILKTIDDRTDIIFGFED